VVIGSLGDAYDNAMAESWVATYKSELVERYRLGSFERAEHETLHWIGFYNTERLHEELGDIPPAEYERNYYENERRCAPPEPLGKPGRFSFAWVRRLIVHFSFCIEPTSSSPARLARPGRIHRPSLPAAPGHGTGAC
jgi:Integrase core domain